MRRSSLGVAVAMLILALATVAQPAYASGEDIPSAMPVSVGQTVSGTIGGGNANDVWSVALTEGEEVTITVMPVGTPGGGGSAQLLAPGAQSIASTTNYGLYRSSVTNRTYVDSYASWAFTPAKSGVYYVWIAADEGSTGYDLTVVRTTNPPLGTADAGDIPGQPLMAGAHRGVVEARTDHDDLYALRFFAGEPVTVRLRPINNAWNNFAYIYVLDPISSSVRSYSTWDQAKNMNGTEVPSERMWSKTPPEIAELTFTPPYTGTFCIWVKASSIAGGVPYELEVSGHAENPGPRTRAYLTPPSAPTSIARYRGFTSAGVITRHTAGTKAVQLRAYRLINSRWVLYRTYTATLLNRSASQSTYSYRMYLYYQGRWKIVAYHPADSGHLATLSAARYVTVK